MAYQVPINQPLSETQAELIAKIGSMKNLLSLKFFKKFFIPEDQQISAYDYILKLLRSMGIDPIILMKSFLSYFFETAHLVDFILKVSSQLATSNGVNLNHNSNFTLSSPPLKKEKEQLNKINFDYLHNSAIRSTLMTVVDALKMQLIKDLMTLMFGAPKTQSGENTMGSLHDNGRMDSLIGASICGSEIFSVSNSIKKRDEDLEYNRINLRKELEAGSANIKVSCKGVEVTFPENPSFLFSNALPGMISSNPITPAQALTNCMDHVANQVQNNTNKNSQSDAKSSQKSFAESLTEKLIINGTTLLSPFFFGMVTPFVDLNTGTSFNSGFQGILALIQIDLLNNQGSAVANLMNPVDLQPPEACEMLSSDWATPNSWTTEQKKRATIIDIICNMLLNAAISFLLSFLISELKKFISAYLAERAISKSKRKTDSILQKFSGVEGVANLAKTAENAQKLKKATQLLAMMKPILTGSVSFT